MPVRTKAWLKLGALGALVVVLTTAFVGALDLPRSSHAQVNTAPLATEASLPRLDAEATRPAADLSEAFIRVSEAVRPAVVFIQAERRRLAQGQVPEGLVPPGFEEFFRFPQRPRQERGQGSGFIVSEDGYILTNHHVVAGAEKVTVRLLDRREFSADVVGSDELTDVAVVKIDATGLPRIPLANSDNVRIGEWVLAVGNPLGEAFAFTVTAGIVSQKGRQLQGLPVASNDPRYRIQDFIQTDAAINPGNSGGPLVNLAGEAIGINSAIASQTGFYQGYGFAIPSNLARAVMEQLVEHGHVRRAVIGVSIAPVTPEAAEYVGLKEITGVVVQEFSSDDSPAKRAGLKAGDVIVAVDGQPIEYVAQLQQTIGFKTPGETVRVTVQRRGGERRTVEVRLAEAATEQTLAVGEAEPEERPASAEGTAVERLGITVKSLTATARRSDARLRELGGQGVVVTAVEPDGPANSSNSSSGLLAQNSPGGPDIILAVNDAPVKSEQEFQQALRDVPHGAVVKLDVYSYQGQSRRIVYLRAR